MRELGWVDEKSDRLMKKTIQVTRCLALALHSGFHDVFESVFSVGGECGLPHNDGGGEDTLDGAPVELGANFQGDVHLPQQSKEEHPLLSSLDNMK